MKCPSCAKELPEDSRFCSGCGSSIQAAAAPSQDATAAAPASPAAAPAKVSTPPQARFVPGTVIAQRYRIVAQVGRGGMGEVYRADDLRLGQTVALKFLPVMRGRNPEDLEQLHREVRIARQISHPNICRVFDIGDSDGMPFLTMEFIDGEDLASLMKRIGRLQPDKAIQLAQQMCAGLAEAHSYGVLHRDLKPANIMLDGRGNARITDFGLALMAGEARGADAWAGTPAYMAPEQLSGEKPTVQSDIYALGLVLYELFTGRDAFPGASVAEILQRRQKGAPAKISGIVKGLDSAIERTILQCLDKDPRSRPRTVLQIAAALPGGNPLAAAIAAGETPSPEMVAAATDQRLTSVGGLWIMLAALIASLAVIGLVIERASVLGLAPLEKSPEAMAEHARELLHRLGYMAPPADMAYWYEVDSAYLKYRATKDGPQDVVRQLRSAVPAPMRFIYRQSQQPLSALTKNGDLDVTLTQPPDNMAGMITMVLDGTGRLLSFSAIPPLVESESPAVSQPDWSPLMAQAGLDEKALTPVTSKWLPLTRFDSHSSWAGVLGGTPVQIIAAGYRGQAVYFRIVAPWMPMEQAEAAPASGMQRMPTLMYLIIQNLTLLGALLLARRNLHLGRGDRKGAARVAITLLIAAVADWLFLARHVTDPAEFYSFQAGIAQALYGAAYVYLAYLAIEPYARRQWPDMLVSWTRALSGRFNDPRVGRDLLAGCLAGALSFMIVLLVAIELPAWFNIPGSSPHYPLLEYAIRSWAGPFGMAAHSLLYGLVYTLGGVVLLLLARFVARRMSLTVAAFIVIGGFMGVNVLGLSLIISFAAGLSRSAVWTFVLFRFGILGLTTMIFTGLLTSNCLLTMDPSRWYFRSTALVLVILAALAIYGFRAALAGRPLFGRVMLEE